MYRALSLDRGLVKRFGLQESKAENKCGLSIQFEYQKRKAALSKKDVDLLNSIFMRDIMDTSIMSTKNNFRIHYNKSGSAAPEQTDNNKNGIPDFVDSVNYYFEYALDNLTNTLKYEGLLPDNNYGGGSEYDIYIKDLSSGNYGYTTFEDMVSGVDAIQRYTTFITIDNDFRDLYTSGMNGLKITAAHELFHAIQIGRYGAWMDDIYYYEIFSTWIETYLFPGIKDYYQYLNTFFTSTNRPLWNHSGYDLTIWGIFIAKKYSPAALKTILEGFKKYSPIKATDAALKYYGASLVTEYADFANWIYFTSYRAKNDAYFPEASNYPLISGSSLKIVNFISPSCTIGTYLNSLASQFYSLKYGNDSVGIISIRANLNEAIEKNENYSQSVLKLSESGYDSRNITLTGPLKALFTAEDQINWKNFYLINNNYLIASTEVQVYPNPYIFNERNKLHFRIPAVVGSSVKYFIFSSDMRLIYEGTDVIKPIQGGNGIDWDGKDKNGKEVSSGVYFYFVKSEGKDLKGKFAVVRK